MKSLHNAKAILGKELFNSLNETFGSNPKELEEIINEAIQTLKMVSQQHDWRSIELDEDDDHDQLVA
jgi:hypothetical protein